MGELVGVVRAQAQVVGAQAELGVPAHPLGQPVLKPLLGLGGGDEVLHLHLLELARAEDEVAGGDLVAEGLADLGDPEGRLLARELQHVLEVDEDPLRGLGAQVGGRARLLDGADRGLEHQVEVARLGQVALLGLAGMLGGFAPALQVPEVVGAEALPAGAAVHQGVGEAGEVPGGLPHARVLQDRRVERHDVVALLQHRAPPLGLDVALQQHPVVAEVVGRAHPSVDLRGGEDEAAALAQRHDLVHAHDLRAARAARRAVGLGLGMVLIVLLGRSVIGAGWYWRPARLAAIPRSSCPGSWAAVGRDVQLKKTAFDISLLTRSRFVFSFGWMAGIYPRDRQGRARQG